MDHYLLIIRFFLVLTTTNAQTGNNTSVINQSWFWPTLSISLALAVSIPSVLTVLIYLYLNKQKSNDDSDVSSTHLTSSILEQPPTRQVHGFRSPPPPYATCERPEHLSMTPSLPPSYESHVQENPTDSTPAVLDLSTTLTSQSIQTFQA